MMYFAVNFLKTEILSPRMVKYTIDHPQKEDFPEMYGLVQELKPVRIFDKLTRKGFKEEAFNHKNTHCLVAKENKKVLGLVSLRVRLFNSIARIGELIINPKYQRKGIGTKLLKSVIKMAKDKSCKFVFLTSHHKRKSARRFYCKNNFKQIGAFFYMRL